MQYGAYFQSAITKTNVCKGMQGNKACQRKCDAGWEQKLRHCLETSVEKNLSNEPFTSKADKTRLCPSAVFEEDETLVKMKAHTEKVHPLCLALFLFLWVIDLLQRQMAHADKSLSDATAQNLAPTLTSNLWREKNGALRGTNRGRN